ncbi:Tricalbin-2, partial [Cryomyces antarcticus]
EASSETDKGIQDDGRTAGYDLPPPTTAGALPPPTSTTPGEPHAHNALVADDKYARVGWAPRFGNPGEKEDDGSTLLDHQTWLEGKLEDKFYGGLYTATPTEEERKTDASYQIGTTTLALSSSHACPHG